MKSHRRMGQNTWQLMQAIAWLEEDSTRCMIVAYGKELHRLRQEYPHIKNQFVPMPKKGHNGRFATHIFIDEVSNLDEELISTADLTNDQIKAWLGRPVIIDL